MPVDGLAVPLIPDPDSSLILSVVDGRVTSGHRIQVVSILVESRDPRPLWHAVPFDRRARSPLRRWWCRGDLMHEAIRGAVAYKRTGERVRVGTDERVGVAFVHGFLCVVDRGIRAVDRGLSGCQAAVHLLVRTARGLCRVREGGGRNHRGHRPRRIIR